MFTSSRRMASLAALPLIVLVSLIGLSHGLDASEVAMGMDPSALDISQRRNPLNSNCAPNSDQYCYFLEAFNYIIFGPNRNDSSSVLDIPPDNETLDWFLTLGLQQLAVFSIENPTEVPGDIDFIVQDLLRLVELLKTNGSTAVTWYDMKYYIKRFANLPNAFKLLSILRGRGGSGNGNFQSYIYNVFLGDIKNQRCRLSLATWFAAIGNPTKNLWALRMFDASGKPPTNLLAANTNWLGNWNSCHKVKYGNSTFGFKGRYCRAKIRADPSLLAAAGSALDGFPGNPAELAAIDLGLCVPDHCDQEDIAILLNNSLKVMTIYQNAFLREADGVQCEGPAQLTSTYYFTIVLITILTSLVIMATIYDCFYRAVLNKPYAAMSRLSRQNAKTICNLTQSAPEPHAAIYDADTYQFLYSNRLQLHGMLYTSEAQRATIQKKRKAWYSQPVYKLHRIVTDLSAYTAILKPMSSTGAMKCLNGMRVISMIWIIWGHTYNYIGDQSYFLLTQNALDLLDFQKERIDAQIIINALYGVDTFFLISATLLTLSLMRFFKKSGMPKWHFWPLMYLERYLRLMPPYIMVFLLYIYVVPHIGRGPLWTAKDFPMKNEDCHNYWWAYILLINNFVPNGKGTRCLGYYWYVSNDFQLFLIAPLLIVPLYFYPMIGMGILAGVLAASSLILGFNIANTYRTGQILVTLQAIWEDTYIKPYCRAGPYVIGILLGYLFFCTEKKKIRLHPLIHVMCWLLTAAFMIGSILLNWQNHGEGLTPMSPGVYTAYFVLSRIAWPLAVSWIMFACYKGLAPLIDSILSWRGFTFFAHMSYTTYLIHPMIMVYYMFAQQNLFHATDITLIYLFLGHLIFSLILGFLAHIIFERPFGTLIGLLLPKRQR